MTASLAYSSTWVRKELSTELKEVEAFWKIEGKSLKIEDRGGSLHSSLVCMQLGT